MFLIFKQTFCFAFQSSFFHYFLIVRTIIFTFYIIYLFEKLLSVDCRICTEQIYNI